MVFYGNAVCHHRYRFYDHRMWMARQGPRRSCFEELKDLRRWTISKKAILEQTGANWHVRCQHLPDRRSSCCLLVWIMKAYLVAVVTLPARQHFNYRLSRVRMCIEKAFGCLKGRWRCIRTAVISSSRPEIDQKC